MTSTVAATQKPTVQSLSSLHYSAISDWLLDRLAVAADSSMLEMMAVHLIRLKHLRPKCTCFARNAT